MPDDPYGMVTPSAGRRRRRVALSATSIALVAVAAWAVIAAPGTTTPGAAPPSQSALPFGVDLAPSDLPLVAVGSPSPPSTGPAAPNTSAGASVSSRAPAASGAVAAPSGPAARGGVRATRIRVARLGIDLPIVQGDGIDAPIGKAAHYPTTAWPGAGSNVYLYAHARDGMFIALWQARIGDEIALDLADGTIRTYRVTTILPGVPWNAMQYLAPTPTEQLTLQTCTSYQQTAPRFLVIAVPSP